MKKKISLLVILAAVFALSSCIIIDSPDYEGSLNVSIDSEYQEYYYVGTIYVDRGYGWEEVWDANDHPKTYYKEAHVNLTEGWYDVMFETYEFGFHKDHHYEDYIKEDVFIDGGHATNFRFGRKGITYK